MRRKETGEVCDARVIHQDTVDIVRQKMPEDDLLQDLAEFYRVFSDKTRVKILCALMAQEMCVCDLSFLMNMEQSAVSHQLRLLKQAGLVKNRRDGKVIYYSLLDEHVRTIFEQGFAHSREDRPPELRQLRNTYEAIHA